MEIVKLTRAFIQLCCNVCNVTKYIIFLIRGKEGEIVSGRRSDKDWVRGKVINLGPHFTLASCDEGRVVPTDSILKLPEKFFHIPSFAVDVKITGDHDLAVNDLKFI